MKLSLRARLLTVLVVVPADSRGGAGPRVPDRALKAAAAAPGSVRSLTVSAASGGTRYRTVVEVLPHGTLVLAKPLTGLTDTVHKLAIVELIVTLVALLGVSMLALWLVRVGLHPLTDIERTAGAIAGGDLTQRVPHSGEGTEVGRLATALNAMLSQIEAAFAQRTASERQLRRFAADASHDLRTPVTTPATVTVGGRDGWAVLEVADHGPGLTPEQSQRVFERFYRADPARTRGKGGTAGTGLGLSIVAAIAGAHAGRASVRSEPGQGTIFRVELPVDGPPAAPPGEEVINLGDDGGGPGALS